MENNRPVVLITGASGFVGRHLTPVLESNGWAVRRAMRMENATSKDFLIENVGRTTDWRAALADARAVIHLAARVHRPNEEHAADLYSDVNIEGTLHLARSAAKAGVRNFVFVSTILVNGRSSDGRNPFSEHDLPTPRGIYGQSKAAAEAGLERIAQNVDMQITVIRPPLIYGAGARGNFNLLARAVMSGIPLPFSLIRNRRAFLAVQNLNSFILQRLVSSDSKFDIFLLADDEQVSTPEFIRRLAKAAGTRSRLFPMPISLLRPALKASGRPEIHESIVGSLELDVSKAASTGWRPLVTLDEGLRLAAVHDK
jgi:UDP-glucose 4-epimerase